MIKHKFFTCHCGSDKCRYSRTNITNFLREYYKRNGEPLPDELTPKNENDVKTTEAQSAKKQCSTKTSVSFSSFLLNSQDGFLKGQIIASTWARMAALQFLAFRIHIECMLAIELSNSFW